LLRHTNVTQLLCLSLPCLDPFVLALCGLSESVGDVSNCDCRDSILQRQKERKKERKKDLCVFKFEASDQILLGVEDLSPDRVLGGEFVVDGDRERGLRE